MRPCNGWTWTPRRGSVRLRRRAVWQRYGPNELRERGSKPPWRIFVDQFTGTLVLILIVAAIISAIIGDFKDAIAILLIVFLNAVLGFVQEYRAEKAMAALQKLAAPTVRVRRDGAVQEIAANQLVPGDIVLLEAGNLAPCRWATPRGGEPAHPGGHPHRRIGGGRKDHRTDRRRVRWRWATSATWPSWARRSSMAAAKWP